MSEPAQSDRERGDAALLRYTLLTQLFDQAFRIPGTGWRFGMDAILGLIPGAGDLSGALVGAYGILVARRLGAPTSIQLRMLMNLALDAVIGAIPVAGDVFDFAFKAHVRNRVLLEKWVARPRATRRSSAVALVAVLVALVAVMIATIWIATLMLRWLYVQCCGQIL